MANKILIAATLMMIASMGAMAAEQGSYSTYSMGFATVDDVKGNSGISGTGLGLSVGGGYNYNKYVGAEVGLNLLGVVGWQKVSAMPISVSVLGYLPIADGINVVGKYGIANTTMFYSGAANSGGYTLSGMTSLWGVGVDFAPDSKTSYRFGVEHFDLSVAPGTSVSSNYFNITAVEHF